LAVDAHIRECKELGFDKIELSCGFITIPPDDRVRLVRQVRDAGLKTKAEVGVQFDAGGGSFARGTARSFSWNACARASGALPKLGVGYSPIRTRERPSALDRDTRQT
jgi:hypothetical protein